MVDACATGIDTWVPLDKFQDKLVIERSKFVNDNRGIHVHNKICKSVKMIIFRLCVDVYENKET